MYSEDDYLALSGIQHFVFCRRQWALIHIEQMWAENALTVGGAILHERAHDEGLKERREGKIIARGLRVHSPSLGLSGVCDVVEFARSAKGFPLAGEEGLWRATPVEYKSGKAKMGDEDRLQLCAQALCLEEMLGSDIPFGFLYYGRTRSREKVEFDSRLRERLSDVVAEMHSLYEGKRTPRVKLFSGCRSCSIADECLPKLPRRSSVNDYIESSLGGCYETPA